MSAVETKVLNVRVSADVKERLSSDAVASESSVNDVAVGILAERYKVKFQGTGRRSPGTHTPEGPLLLRMPVTLYRKIHAAAIDCSKTEVVERELREHYSLAPASVAA